ncbi:MAG TPA: RidA family protein [Syntrophomonadaceae bacterium]|nr:RidA family protein [Syntrophomonadaceae bacterium]
MMNVEDRLRELNLTLPPVNKPLAAYVPAVSAGSLVFISGQLPLQDGKLVYSGKVGRDLSVEEGQAAARIAVINCLAALRDVVPSWESIDSIVKITGYIQCEGDFYQQPQVLNGASELLEQIFSSRGCHARVALGVNALPLNAACEVEMIAQLKIS